MSFSIFMTMDIEGGSTRSSKQISYYVVAN